MLIDLFVSLSVYLHLYSFVYYLFIYSEVVRIKTKLIKCACSQTPYGNEKTSHLLRHQLRWVLHSQASGEGENKEYHLDNVDDVVDDEDASV